MTAEDLRAQLQAWADERQAIHDHEAETGECDTTAFQYSEDAAVELCHATLAYLNGIAEAIHEADEDRRQAEHDEWLAARYEDLTGPEDYEPSPYDGTYSED